MANIDIEGILKELPHSDDGLVPRAKIVYTLGPASRSVPMIEKLLRASMNIARFNFSHGTHEYHQETLNNLRIAMHYTQILCAVMLDTKMNIVKVSSIMGIGPKPFDPKTYVEEETFVTDGFGAKGRLRLENNIVRWRRVRNPDGTTFVSKSVTCS